MLSKINPLDAGIMTTMAVHSGMPFIVVDHKFMPLIITLTQFYSSNIEDPSEHAVHEGYLTSKDGEFSKLVFSMDLSNLKEDEECRGLSNSELSEFLGYSELPKVLEVVGLIKGWHINDVMFLIDAEKVHDLLGI